MNQQTIFDMLYPSFKLNKPIRLIEFFAGYGSQALALKYLGVPFEHWKTCEWAIKSIQAYKDIHMTNDNTDYSKELTEEQIKEYLFNKGISSNYNDPMSEQQVNKLNNVRTIYNNIVATHNLVNIQQVKGKDLEIIDKDKYDYILTYSFPCQDLSLAGKGKGMSDTTTRSGMLWEVERILTECHELGQLPQVLLMENVPQVHGKGNIEDFNKWRLRLEELGYKNYWQDLIATDYGIPQTRNRCFMISILGNYSYKFPEPIPLKIKLKDLLEDQVDEKYYLSDKCIKTMLKHDTDYKPTGLSPTLTTELSHHTGKNFTPKIIREIDYSLKIKNANSKGYLEAEEGDVVKHSYTQQIMDGNKKCVEKNDGNMITLTTRGDCVGVCVGTYQYAKSDNFMQGRDRLQLGKDVSDTLQTTQKEGVVLKPQVLGGVGEKDSNNGTQWKQQNRIYDDNVLISVTTGFNPYYKADLRIRKLTPKECFRLMGVKDQDFENVKKNQSDASLYHLAGDSIVVNVLMAIFKELL